MKCNEATTRKDIIDPQIAAAGWNPLDTSQVRLEILVDGYDYPSPRHLYRKSSPISSDALNVSALNNAKPHAKLNTCFRRFFTKHSSEVYSL